MTGCSHYAERGRRPRREMTGTSIDERNPEWGRVHFTMLNPESATGTLITG